MTPSHSPLAVGSHTLENPIGITAKVMTYGYHRGIYETDTAALAKGLKLHEEHQVEEYAWHEFYESIIRHGIRKIIGKMLLYIKKVVMLEIGE